MAYLYEFPNVSNGVDQAVVGLVGAVPIFVPMFLLFVYLVVLIAGSSAQARRTGNPDVPMWSTLGGLSCLMISLALSLVSGLIQVGSLAIVVVVTIASGIWLFMDRNSREI